MSSPLVRSFLPRISALFVWLEKGELSGPVQNVLPVSLTEGRVAYLLLFLKCIYTGDAETRGNPQPRCLPPPGRSRPEAESWERNPCFSGGWQGPNLLNSPLLPPRVCLSRQLEWGGSLMWDWVSAHREPNSSLCLLFE